MAIDTGGIVYHVTADTASAMRGINQVESGFNKVGASAKKMGGGISKVATGVRNALNAIPLKAMAAGATAAVAAVNALVVKMSAAEKELQILSRQAGKSIEDFRKLTSATNAMGISAEKFADISKDVKDKLGEYAAAGTGAFQDFADVMKLTDGQAVRLANRFKHMSGDDVLGEMVDMMQKAGKSTADMTFALESMGSDASRLIPLFENNGAALRKMGEEYDKFNDAFAITGEQSKDLLDVSRNIDRLKEATSSAGRAISADLAPVMNQFLEDTLAAMPAVVAEIRDALEEFTAFFLSGQASGYASAFLDPWLNIFDDMKNGLGLILDLFEKGFAVIGVTGDSVTSGLSKKFLAIPDSIKAFIQLAVNYLLGFKDKVVEFAGLIGKALDFNVLFDAPSKYFANLNSAYETYGARVEQINSVVQDGAMEILDAYQKEIDAIDAKIAAADREREAYDALKSSKEAAAQAGLELDETGKPVIRVGGGQSLSKRGETVKEKAGREALGKAARASRGLSDDPYEVQKADEEEKLRAIQEYFEKTMAFSEFANATKAEVEEQYRQERAMAEAEGLTQAVESIDEHYQFVLESLQAHEEAKTAILEEGARARAEIARMEREEMLQAYSDLAGGVSSVFGALADASEKSGEKQSGFFKAMFALSKGFAVAQAGLNLTLAISNALASAPFPANIAAMASVASAGASLVSAISGATYGGGRKMGGPVSDGNYYQVNETGVPEVYSAGGKDFLMGTRNATVTPLDKMGGGGGGVTVNNFAGAEVTAQQTDDGWVIDIARREAEKAAGQAYNRVAKDFARNTGSVYNAARGGTNIQGKPGAR